jgi:acyl-CoA reductase-like NAD-dependent aldehyde dehydrogenase
MKALLTAATLLLAFAGAHAGEVYKTTDAQGRPVYTDKPPSLPAERLKVQSATTDVVEVLKQYGAADQAEADAAKKAADARKAQEMTAEDRAKRCIEARQRYESYMNARRLYEPGTDEGERRYLDSAEIDAARANAKQAMDDLCSGP